MSGDVKDPKVPTSGMRSGRVLFRYNEIELPTPEGITSHIFKTTLYPTTRLWKMKPCIGNSLSKIHTHIYLHTHQSKKVILASIYPQEMPTVSPVYLII